jgi:hypothetical protein
MDPIKFEWLGLHLQEPMAVVTNGMLSLFSLYAYLKLRKWDSEANYWWRLFYLIFGVSTFFGALGHAFFLYFGVFGKFPCWILGCLANVCAARGMLAFAPFVHPKRSAVVLIWVKSAVLLVMALISQKFLFVAIDAILTYIAYTGAFAFILTTRGVAEMKFMVMGVIILVPSAFIFLLKLNPHRWLNKDDLSHLLMLTCIYCFYKGMMAWGSRSDQQLKNV